MFNFTKRLAGHKARKGFSLVELVVVILIIAILAAMLFLGGATVIGQAREREVQSDLKNFGTYVQDMLYDNPELQYYTGKVVAGANAGFGTKESYTFDAKTTTLNGGTDKLTTFGNATFTGTDLSLLPVLTLLNDQYLTDDFQLGKILDSWGNPYCWSYDMSPSSGTGDPASCIIVINSLGENSLDETSDATITPDTELKAAEVANLAGIAASYIGKLGSDGYKSASDIVAKLGMTQTGDDYGVIIVMIDGQVSIDYYGF